jgi:hypothetical protein
MKKALNVTFAVLAMMALAACGSDSGEEENGGDTTATAVTPAPATMESTPGDTTAVEDMTEAN